ncbi:Cytochrome c1 heme lyase [Ceratobasidium sp. 395]|nr:Cytochrome c1 heme lyase [Ceratobasidium sp. 395]
MSSHEEETTADKCPVDHTNRAAWANLKPPSWHPPVPSTPDEISVLPSSTLPTSRETSSIPRLDGHKWVYPSEAQFFSAMARKNHNPQAPDMRVVVPIHNAVNERAWGELLAWEAGRGGEACGGVKLVSFKGRPGDRTPKAWFKTLLGRLLCTAIKHRLTDTTGS